jgi:hypothetical protein
MTKVHRISSADSVDFELPLSLMTHELLVQGLHIRVDEEVELG